MNASMMRSRGEPVGDGLFAVDLAGDAGRRALERVALRAMTISSRSIELGRT
jgi:hypothetical protein